MVEMWIHARNDLRIRRIAYHGKLYPTTAGTPQGGIISPTLCNLALDGIETMMRERFPVNKALKGGRPKVHLCRYADDMIVTGKDKEYDMRILRIRKSSP
jgi:retron-type reverse transcriptase